LTATGAAFARAFHATHDDVKIFDDFLAAALFTPDEIAELERMSAKAAPLLNPDTAGLAPEEALSRLMRSPGTSNLLSRGRYTEDRLVDEIGRGAAQYVVLGAGLDTFAFRRRDLLERLRMFEVDRPDMQADKQRRIARAGWQVPAQLRFVALDLMKGDLTAALAGAGFDPSLRTFWSWMGVTHYLTRDAVLGTLRTLARLGAPGSVVVFDHLDLDAFDDAKASPFIRRTRAVVAGFGEAMGFGFDPAAMAADLDSVGLTLVEQLTPADIQARYFAGRSDGYRALEHTHFAAATTR
jgi:methyltransferase (TIGR00027 family)